MKKGKVWLWTAVVVFVVLFLNGCGVLLAPPVFTQKKVSIRKDGNGNITESLVEISSTGFERSGESARAWAAADQTARQTASASDISADAVFGDKKYTFVVVNTSGLSLQVGISNQLGLRDIPSGESAVFGTDERVVIVYSYDSDGALFKKTETWINNRGYRAVYSDGKNYDMIHYIWPKGR